LQAGDDLTFPHAVFCRPHGVASGEVLDDFRSSVVRESFTTEQTRRAEGHRSQYGFGGKVNEKTGEMSYGFASNLRDALPNASFIGLTPSLPPLVRASPDAVHCLCRSAQPLSSHRHAHREDGREHAGGLRRLHLMLPSGRTLRAHRFAPVHLVPRGSIYDIQRAVADKATEWQMSNDEFGMSNGLNFDLRTLAFARRPPSRCASAPSVSATERTSPRLFVPAA